MGGKPMKRNGITLLELLFTLAISSIILTLAVPNYQRFIANQQLSQAAQQVLSLLYYARQLAVLQGGAYVCDGELGCHNFQRTHALEIYLPNHTDTLSSHHWVNFAPAISVQWRRFRGEHLYFNAQGRSIFSNGHFLICHQNARHLAYKVVLNWSGRARIERTDTMNC